MFGRDAPALVSFQIFRSSIETTLLNDVTTLVLELNFQNNTLELNTFMYMKTCMCKQFAIFWYPDNNSFLIQFPRCFVPGGPLLAYCPRKRKISTQISPKLAETLSRDIFRRSLDTQFKCGYSTSSRNCCNLLCLWLALVIAKCLCEFAYHI